ncbi:histidine kinase [Bosea sp. AAP35]|uniref:sensor histidine kinase n=1 Tax=Bosea sp. AAP35 TaxID=1523417 RepID=UPI0006B9AF2E|nr:PAS domain-containing sensor histidine kinase [Bosea sp. AAP35]KPF66431.1 histidine kinase [Bosea sp. AAP35]
MAPSSTGTPPELSLGLALAVISTSDAPLLLLDSDLAIIVASRSFCRTFELDPASMEGQHLSAIGAGEWNVPQLVSLLRATADGLAAVEAYEMTLHGTGNPRRLIVNAHKLDYGEAGQGRLLLSVSDVTDARRSERQKDELLREKAILLQELQHRVANSLQIIASILMQSARKVQSEESRGHLRDAHNRVMSIASLQQQLATSQLGQVPLRAYLTNLCRSIAASMIPDQALLTLETEIDDSTVDADMSISLGLVVTELVINALKHAFPGDRGGTIKVIYRADETSWTLDVVDDGVGMSKAADDAKGGLGTSIVRALAQQLEADITVTDAKPGTVVSLRHMLAADRDDAPLATEAFASV